MAATNYELKNIQDDDNDIESSDRSPDVLVVGGRQQQQSSSIGPHHDIRPQNQPDDGFRSEPLDIYKFVFIIFLVHGVGTLMPWNMFCTADGYFRDYKLLPNSGNGTAEVKESLQSIRTNWYFYLGMASQVPNLLFSGLNLLVDLGAGNLKTRVNFSLTVELAVFILTIILASIDSSGWQIAFFYITMTSIVVLNMVAGIYQNCVFGTTAKFPPLYTNAVLIGSNLSGTYTSIVNILSIYLAPEPQTAAIYYFVTAVLAILICLITYNLLPWLKFYRYFDLRKDEPNQIQADDYVIISKGPSENPSNEVPENLRETVDAMVPKPSNETTFKQRFEKKLDVLLKCKGQLFNIYLTFFVTLALFPAVLVNVQSEQENLSNYFSPVCCFLVFNSAALIGNIISYYTSWPGKDRVWLLSVLRILFIPFFLFCNFKPSVGETRNWPVLIHNDIVYTIGNFLMGVSSGYLSSICMMFVSTGLNQEESIIAGMLGGFFLIFGIFTGVMSTSLLTRIVY